MQLCGTQTTLSETKPTAHGTTAQGASHTDVVFSNVGLHCAGLVYLKQGSMHKPVIVKAYVCLFVSLSYTLKQYLI